MAVPYPQFLVGGLAVGITIGAVEEDVPAAESRGVLFYKLVLQTVGIYGGWDGHTGVRVVQGATSDIFWKGVEILL